MTREAMIFMGLTALTWFGVVPTALLGLWKARTVDAVLGWLLLTVIALIAGIFFLMIAGQQQ